MTQNNDVMVTLRVQAPVSKVWNAFVDPAVIKEYMFGTETVSDWKEGSSIVWKGEWEGKPYEDTGTVVAIEPERLLKYSHASGSGSQHTVTIELAEEGDETVVTLTQDNNASEESAAESKKNWEMMLGGMKKIVEG